MLVILQWIGAVLTIVGFAVAVANNNSPVCQYQQTSAVEQNRFLYSNVNVAYDVTNGKYFFQHPDGSWKEYPPKPF